MKKIFFIAIFSILIPLSYSYGDTITWANGDTYVGEFIDSKRHGQGTKTNADGSEMKGIWEEGGLVESN